MMQYVKVNILAHTRIYFLLILLGAAPAATYALRIVTYNIRYNNPGDGENAWPLRKDKVGALLHRYNPDIICLQEVLYGQLTDLQQMLPEYAYVGIGREKGRKGEFSPVFYRKDLFRVEEWKTVWLSESRKPGSKGWDAALPRIFTYAEIVHIPSGKHFLVLSTHFDHKGRKAREESATQLVNFIKAFTHGNAAYPVLVGGDMNAGDTTLAYRNLMQDGLLKDSYVLANATDHPYTCCGFPIDPPPHNRIDYILTSSAFSVTQYTVDMENNGRFFPSDHLPVIVDVEWK